MNEGKCANCSTILNGQETFCRICGSRANTDAVYGKETTIDHPNQAILFQQPTAGLQKWQIPIPLLIIGVIFVEFVFFAIVAAVGGRDSVNPVYLSSANNSNAPRGVNSAYSSVNGTSHNKSENTSTFYSSGNGNTSSLSGSEGYLIENLNIRSAPNRTAEIRGTHYKDARIRVLDEESYSTTDGYSTWYKVKVLSYGCDSQNTSSCGKNWERNGSFGWMEGDDEGWMNAKYIQLN